MGDPYCTLSDQSGQRRFALHSDTEQSSMQQRGCSGCWGTSSHGIHIFHSTRIDFEVNDWFKSIGNREYTHSEPQTSGGGGGLPGAGGD